METTALELWSSTSWSYNIKNSFSFLFFFNLVYKLMYT